MTTYTAENWLWGKYQSLVSIVDKDRHKYAASGNTSTWEDWADDTTSATWTNWQSTVGTAGTDDIIWAEWNDGQYRYVRFATRERLPEPVRTPEEVARLEAERIRLAEMARKQREESDKRQKEEAERKKIAEEKSLQLLLENLQENQAEIFKRTGAIPVISPSGRRYNIRKGTSGNVDELIDQSEVRKSRLCFHPADYNIPVYDVMLAQKLMLEVCEEEARKIANFS